MKPRQILAIIGIALLLIMYVMTLIFAIFDNPNTMHFFVMSVVATVIIPVFLYVINMFLKLGEQKRDMNSDIAKGKYKVPLDEEAGSAEVETDQNNEEYPGGTL